MILILEYLSIEQTLNYLERETGYQYTFDDLKELSYLKQIDVFFYKIGAIYHHRTEVEPAPLVKPDDPPTAIKSWDYATNIERLRGIYYVEDLIMYEPTDDEQTYYFNYKFVTVEKVIEHLCFFSDEQYSHRKGDQGELADIGLLDLEYYECKRVKLSSVRKKKITTVKRNELRLKKAQLDKLIKQSNSSTSTLVEIDSLKNENDQLKQCIAKLEKQLEQSQSSRANDEPTHHKSVGSMTVLIATLLKLAEYDKDDLKQPHGAINKEIQAKAEGLGLSIKKDFIEKWLKKADDIL